MIELDQTGIFLKRLWCSPYGKIVAGRKLGVILLCRESEGPVEGLCRSYVYLLESVLKFLKPGEKAREPEKPKPKIDYRHFELSASWSFWVLTE